VGPGFTSEIVDVEPSVTTLNDLDFALNELVFAEAAIHAAEAGFSAILINSCGDYGLRAMRAAIEVPVVGCGQASMQVAAGLGKRFGIVTVWPPVYRTMYERILVEYGFDDRCVGVWFVTDDEELGDMYGGKNLMKDMRSGHGSVLDRIERRGHEAIAAGADVIVLGCTCMSPIRDELAKRWPRPVLDPLVTGHKLAELLVSMGVGQAEPAVAPTARDMLGAMLHGREIEPPPYVAECDDTCSDLRASAR
jgi:allantoin racemase